MKHLGVHKKFRYVWSIVGVQCKVFLKHLGPMLGQINVFHRLSQNRITCGPPQGVSDKISATVCPRSSYLFYVVTYNIKWVTTSWTDPNTRLFNLVHDLRLLFDYLGAFDYFNNHGYHSKMENYDYLFENFVLFFCSYILCILL